MSGYHSTQQGLRLSAGAIGAGDKAQRFSYAPESESEKIIIDAPTPPQRASQMTNAHWIVLGKWCIKQLSAPSRVVETPVVKKALEDFITNFVFTAEHNTTESCAFQTILTDATMMEGELVTVVVCSLIDRLRGGVSQCISLSGHAGTAHLYSRVQNGPGGSLVSLGRFGFPSQGAARQRCRDILHNAEENVPLTGEDFEFVSQVLRHHPRAVEKFDAGSSVSIYVAFNPQSQIRSFIMQTPQGKEELSYVRALSFVTDGSDHLVHAVCETLSQIICFFPRALSDLTERLAQRYPRLRVSLDDQLVYLKGCLTLISRIPQIRQSLLKTVLSNFTAMDLEVKLARSDAVDPEQFGIWKEQQLALLAQEVQKGTVPVEAVKRIVEKKEWFESMYRQVRCEEDINAAAFKMDVLLHHFLSWTDSELVKLQNVPAPAHLAAATSLGVASSSAEEDDEEDDEAYDSSATTTERTSALAGPLSMADIFVADVLGIFRSVMLPTPRSRYIQYYVFYVTSLKVQWAEKYLQILFGVLFDADAPLPLRRAATSYIASFVGRANYLPLKFSRTTLVYLLQFLSEFLCFWEQRSNLNAPANSSGELSKVDETAQPGCTSRIELHTSKPHLNPNSHLTLFYAVCQTVCYILCFMGDFLRYSDEPIGGESGGGSTGLGDSVMDLTFLEVEEKEKENKGKSFKTILHSHLSPLFHCKRGIMLDFIQTCRRLRLFTDSESQFQEAERFASRAQQGTTDKSFDFDAMEGFLPFDPYHLRLSGRYVRPLYRSWNDVQLRRHRTEAYSRRFGVAPIAPATPVALKVVSAPPVNCGSNSLSQEKDLGGSILSSTSPLVEPLVKELLGVPEESQNIYDSNASPIQDSEGVCLPPQTDVKQAQLHHSPKMPSTSQGGAGALSVTLPASAFNALISAFLAVAVPATSGSQPADTAPLIAAAEALRHVTEQNNQTFSDSAMSESVLLKTNNQNTSVLVTSERAQPSALESEREKRDSAEALPPYVESTTHRVSDVTNPLPLPFLSTTSTVSSATSEATQSQSTKVSLIVNRSPLHHSRIVDPEAITPLVVDGSKTPSLCESEQSTTNTELDRKLCTSSDNREVSLFLMPSTGQEPCALNESQSLDKQTSPQTTFSALEVTKGLEQPNIRNRKAQLSRSFELQVEVRSTPNTLREKNLFLQDQCQMHGDASGASPRTAEKHDGNSNVADAYPSGTNTSVPVAKILNKQARSSISVFHSHGVLDSREPASDTVPLLQRNNARRSSIPQNQLPVSHNPLKQLTNLLRPLSIACITPILDISDNEPVGPAVTSPFLQERLSARDTSSVALSPSQKGVSELLTATPDQPHGGFSPAILRKPRRFSLDLQEKFIRQRQQNFDAFSWQPGGASENDDITGNDIDFRLEDALFESCEFLFQPKSAPFREEQLLEEFAPFLTHSPVTHDTTANGMNARSTGTSRMSELLNSRAYRSSLTTLERLAGGNGSASSSGTRLRRHKRHRRFASSLRFSRGVAFSNNSDMAPGSTTPNNTTQDYTSPSTLPSSDLRLSRGRLYAGHKSRKSSSKRSHRTISAPPLLRATTALQGSSNKTTSEVASVMSSKNCNVPTVVVSPDQIVSSESLLSTSVPSKGHSKVLNKSIEDFVQTSNSHFEAVDTAVAQVSLKSTNPAVPQRGRTLNPDGRRDKAVKRSGSVYHRATKSHTEKRQLSVPATVQRSDVLNEQQAHSLPSIKSIRHLQRGDHTGCDKLLLKQKNSIPSVEENLLSSSGQPSKRSSCMTQHAESLQPSSSFDHEAGNVLAYNAGFPVQKSDLDRKKRSRSKQRSISSQPVTQLLPESAATRLSPVFHQPTVNTSLTPQQLLPVPVSEASSKKRHDTPSESRSRSYSIQGQDFLSVPENRSLPSKDCQTLALQPVRVKKRRRKTVGGSFHPC